jgi:hypothetical protein
MKLIGDNLQCLPGSLFNPYTNTCTTCSTGYYKQNNTYFDNIGISRASLYKTDSSVSSLADCTAYTGSRVFEGDCTDSFGTTNHYKSDCVCNIYNNEKSYAYITTGGYNYDYNYILKKNIFDIDNFLKQIAEKTIKIIAKIYNNRKILNSSLIGFAIVLGYNQNVHY